MATQSKVDIDDYREIIGDENVERIIKKADALRGQRVCHMNSTFHAGGVVELLISLVGLQNQLGIITEWRLLRGTEAFYEVTRALHDALQNGELGLNADMKRVFDETFADNAVQNHLDHDAVYMHDHHTVGMVEHYRKKGPWIWRCHLDLSDPHPDAVAFLKPYVDQYSAGIVILEEYKQDAFSIPQHNFLPAIDPTKVKSRTLSDEEVRQVFEKYEIPTDKPIVTQISRFDRWKDPLGVVEAYDIASEEIDATLVMAGNRPGDDPEHNPIEDELMSRQSERIIVREGSDPMLVSALQQEAAVVLQKSIREGFGLTVSEALWKGTPVIGGNVGGIPQQIEDGVNGYLVNSPQEAAERMVELVGNPDKAREMGAKGKETVREKFLMTRLLEQHLDLLAGMEPVFVPTGEVPAVQETIASRTDP